MWEKKQFNKLYSERSIHCMSRQFFSACLNVCLSVYMSVCVNVYVCMHVCLLAPYFFDFFFERGDSLLKPCLLLLSLLQQILGSLQLNFIHRLDVCRLFAPFRLQPVQLVGQTTILRFQETNLLYVAGKPLVQVLQQHKIDI